MFTTFVRRLFAFRTAHAALHHADWIEPAHVAWRDAAGNIASSAYLDDATRPVLGWQLDGAALGDAARSIYVVYNRGPQQVALTLPPPPVGMWFRVANTAAWMEPQGNFAAPGDEAPMTQSRYDLDGRALAIFVAK
jgi:glycogen operon protein